MVSSSLAVSSRIQLVSESSRPARMHRHRLPVAAFIDKRQCIKSSEGISVSGACRAGKRTALALRNTTHNRRVAIDEDCHVSGLQFRVLQLPGSQLVEQLLSRHLLPVTMRPDEAFIRQRFQSFEVSGEHGLMKGGLRCGDFFFDLLKTLETLADESFIW